MIAIERDLPAGTYDVFGRDSALGIRLEEKSGTPLGLVERSGADEISFVPLAVGISLVLGGKEVLSPIGGLEYVGTERFELDQLIALETRCEDCGGDYRYRVCSQQGGWNLDLIYIFRDAEPRLELGVAIRRGAGADEATLRDLVLTYRFPTDDPSEYMLNAPGAKFRADLAVDSIATPLRVLGPADVHGGPALVSLTDNAATRTTLVWSLPTSEQGLGEVEADPDALRFTFNTGMAGTVGEDCALSWRGAHLESRPEGWPLVRARLQEWYGNLGIGGPAGRPEWIRGAHIFEAHVGYSVFADGWRYQRYATPGELREDLPRIQDLGFDVIQLMPRHPYPSYNVHDYADLNTTYGNEDEVRELVAECHRRGMKVLLDVILHGVIDREVMKETLDSVLSGPYAERLSEGGLEYLADTSENVAWARHIFEYAPHWRAGSPERSTLPEEHPEWFMRDSRGEITRRYTKAFDLASPGWQRYFIDACLEMTDRLGTDGFRVDAPTYNNFASWAPGRRQRASYGPMATLPLLRSLSAELRSRDPEAAVYTEPGGALFRATADMTYNYDEHWLVESLLDDFDNPDRDWRLVRTARELAAWLRDRDLAEPAGAGIVQHVDSHDSIWWRLPGEQWRRERFGQAATVGLIALFSVGMPGAYMMFMGGEEQVEPELRQALKLRRELPELATGSCTYLTEAASSDQILVALRELGERRSLVLINLSPEQVSSQIRVDWLPTAAHDHWSDEVVEAGDGQALTFAPYQPRIIGLS
jgi:glycosidase